MTGSPEFDPEHIEAKKDEIRNALSAEGIEPEDFIEMDPDDALNTIGIALLKHQPPMRDSDDN